LTNQTKGNRFKYLLNRKYEPEKPYGIFDEGITMCKFFDTNDMEII
jgi:hypothetical protein